MANDAAGESFVVDDDHSIHRGHGALPRTGRRCGAAGERGDRRLVRRRVVDDGSRRLLGHRCLAVGRGGTRPPLRRNVGLAVPVAPRCSGYEGRGEHLAAWAPRIPVALSWHTPRHPPRDRSTRTMILDETYTLSNGLDIPKLGLGTWFIDNDDAAQAVRDAATIGYRH